MKPPVDASLFADAADALGIAEPGIVEKDYYAVQLLRLLCDLKFEGYTLVFAGGTCLAKAYRNTYRMSEDIDLKLVPSEETVGLTKSRQRTLRRAMFQQVKAVIEGSDLFTLEGEPQRQNEGRYQVFRVRYPRGHREIGALRPHLLLEITESRLTLPAVDQSIQSLFAQVAEQPPEVVGLPCAALETIAAEKFVALARRTALVDRDFSQKDDETLIRHIYDLHLVQEALGDLGGVAALVQQAIHVDLEQFGHQHPEFVADPHAELRRGLELIRQPTHAERYRNFTGPLVYHQDPPDWEEVCGTLETLAEAWLL